MKSVSRKSIILGLWIAILLVISVCKASQGERDLQEILLKFPKSLWECGILYMIFTLHYVIALVTKQFIKLPVLLLADIICMAWVTTNFGYFYEGPQVFRNSMIVLIIMVVIRILILVFKKSRMHR